ncbi:MAG: type II secretion system protein [Candidatus Paceibacterota bacterium]|jgi:hypothetical protein
MSTHYIDTKHGFTLIETVIVVALSVVMMIVVSILVYNFTAISAYQQALTQSSGSATMLIRELESLAIPADAVLQTHDFSSATYSSSPTVLVLEIPSIDDSGNVISGKHDYAAFYTTGTDSYRILEADQSSARASGTKKLSSTMHELTFSYDSVDFTFVSTVTAYVHVQATTKQGILSDHRNVQIRLRNH